MATPDIKAVFDFKKQDQLTLETAMDAIRSIFPVIGPTKRMELKRLWAGTVPQDDDYADMKQKLLQGKSWGYPVFANLRLEDAKTGKKIDEVDKIRLMEVPRFTTLYGYLVDGAFKYTQNQLRLKSGAYSVVMGDGDFQTQVMTEKGHNFKVDLDPATSIFTITPSTSTAAVKLLPILLDLGLTPNKVQSAWGQDVFQVNLQKTAGVMDSEILKFYRALFSKPPPPDKGVAIREIRDYFENKTKISPDTTARSLGRPSSIVTPDLFLASTQRLLSMSRGKGEPDDRNSPGNKELHSVDTFLREYIQSAKEKIKTSVLRQIEKRDSIRESISAMHFNKPVKSFFSNSSMSTQIKQTNPVEMAGERFKVTLMGEGGIQTERAVTEDLRKVHGAQIGLIDPIHTPEGSSIGTSISVTLGAHRKGNDLAQYLISTKTHRLVEVTAREMSEAVVAFPGQYTEKNGRYVANSPNVRVLNKTKDDIVSPDKVDYILPSTKGMFSISANLIPFLNSVDGARAMMGSKHVDQALALKDPEAPLVQSLAAPGMTFERLVGSDSATMARVPGTVTKVTPDWIHVKGAKGEEKHGIFNYFPLNEKSYLHSAPLVKPGDKVEKGQPLADSTFTKGGTLALGKNLHVAYLPWKGGHSFEDGVVISEAAAQKLTSLHMYKMLVKGGDGVTLDTKAFSARYPSIYTQEQLNKLSPNGIVARGQTLHKGDPLGLRLVREQLGPEDRLMAKLRRGFIQPEKNRSVLWEEDFPGIVEDVIPSGEDYMVSVRTEEPARVGDKTSVRMGGKGIISKILPDSEMPHTMDGKAIEVMLNPGGVSARMNVGQTMENLAAKVAKVAGQPIHVDNFAPGNQTQKVLDLAKKYGIKDKEDLIDPATGKMIPQVAVGYNYIYKLNHPVRSKFAARSLGPYQEDLTPTKGEGQGGLSLDILTSYAALAHGAKSILREKSLKGQANPEWWRAYRMGQTLPLPRDRAVFNRFTDMLKGAGINVEKRGSQMLLLPLLDKDVMAFSNGKIEKPLQLQAKNLSPEKYGLFDPKVTGGVDGHKWSHFELAEPLPHPTFEEPIRVLTGLTAGQLADLVAGRAWVDSVTGKLTTTKTNLTGGEAVKFLLKQINVDKKMAELKEQMPTLKATALDKVNKEYRFLNALKETGKKPEDYVVTKIPVLPPKLRPVYPDENGNLRHSDLNYLYRDLMLVNQSLDGMKGLPDSEKVRQRAALYDGVKALAGIGSKPVLSQGEERKGILTQIAGTPQPKFGFFQNKILKSRQDLTGKSTIVNSPDMGIDEVGIPQDMAWQLFRERGIRELVTVRGRTILQAQELWDKREPLARDALVAVMKDQPVLLNRAPSLHKFSLMAFNPILRADKTIGLHPLIMKGFNADIDGDNMFVHVPVLPQSIQEAKRMMPSVNLFNPRDKSLIVMPSKEAVHGLYLASQDPKAQKEVEALLPRGLRDPKRIWNKSAMADVLTELATKFPGDFAHIVNKLKDMGNEYAYYRGTTLGASDLIVPKGSIDRLLLSAEKTAQGIRTNKKLSKAEKDTAIIQIFQGADKKVLAEQKKVLEGTQLGHLLGSNSWASPDQIKKISIAPVLFDSAKGTPAPMLVKSNLAEGMTPSDYWVSLYGARKGMIDKGLSTAKPGELNKALINSMGKYVITMKDCGTKRSVPVHLKERLDAHSALGHVLAVAADGMPAGQALTQEHLKRLQKDKVEEIKIRTPLICEAPHGLCAVCYGIQAEKGNFPPIGENVGAIAANSIAEPQVQMVMKAFHTAGLSSVAGAGITSQFDRIDQILSVPKTLPASATLAKDHGKVTKVEEAAAGGFHVHVGEAQHFVKPGLQVVVKPGDVVKKGDQLSSGLINPHDLLELKGAEATRKFLANELYQTFNTGGTALRKVHADVAARAMTNFGKVIDPGDHPEYIHGDIAPASRLDAFKVSATSQDTPVKLALGRRLSDTVGDFKKGTTIDATVQKMMQDQGLRTVKVDPKAPMYEPILVSAAQAPLKTTDWLSRMGTSNIKQTLLSGAAQMWRTNTHGPDPVPAMAVGTEIGEHAEGLY